MQVTLSGKEARDYVKSKIGRYPARATLYNWAIRGVLIAKERVHLESYFAGGIHVTTTEAIDAFLTRRDRR